MSSASQSPDPRPSSETDDGLEVFKIPLKRQLVYRKAVVGRYSVVPGWRRPFLVKPIASIPLESSSLGSHLETEYAKFYLRVYEGGAIIFTLGPNDAIEVVLDSVSWAYSRLLGGKRK